MEEGEVDSYEVDGEIFYDEPHVHSDNCYKKFVHYDQLVCSGGHTHDESCYKEVTEKKYLCGKEEHEHSEKCYKTEEPEEKPAEKPEEKPESHVHDWSEWRVSVTPTETEMGELRRVCQTEEEHQETRILPTLNGTWEEKNELVKATCTEGGETEYVLWATKDVNEVRLVVETKALGHEWKSWTMTQAPTKEAEGSAQRLCGRDEEHREAMELPVLTDTSFWALDEEKSVPATETEEGKEVYVAVDEELEFTVTVKLPAEKNEQGKPSEPEKKPDEIETKPGDTEEKPDGIETKPGDTEEKPDGIESKPGDTEEKPDETETNPGETEEKPEGGAGNLTEGGEEKSPVQSSDRDNEDDDTGSNSGEQVQQPAEEAGEEELEDEDVPLSAEPEELEDEAVALSQLPEEVSAGDGEEVVEEEELMEMDIPLAMAPLAQAPQTGDSLVWYVAAFCSGSALVWGSLTRKREEED